MNPFDEYAIEEGIRLKERFGGTVTAVSVGDATAELALREALALGVDNAVLLTDPQFGGVDPFTTARILAAGVRKIGAFDLVICGKQAVDDDTSLVPGALAGFLHLPQVIFVKRIETVEGAKATVHRMTEEGYEVVETQLPAVISVVKEINEPRLPSLKGKMRARSAPVTKYSAADLGLTDELLAPKMRVVKVSPPPARTKGEMLEGSPEEIAEKLFRKLREAQVI
jgi:electron transfer flavoprotein beta subunit